MFKTNETPVVFVNPETSHNRVRDFCRIIAKANQTRHPDRRLNRSPALYRHIDRDKHVARKQRCRDHLQLAGMPPALEIAWQVDGEILIAQVPAGFCLAARLGMGDVPAHHGCRLIPPALAACARY